MPDADSQTVNDYHAKIEAMAFPTLDPDEFDRLRPLASAVDYAAGDYILRHGEADTDLVVVEHGSVEIENPADESDRHIAWHHEGSFIGDVDLLTRRPVIFDAVARGGKDGTPTRVLRVPGKDLRRLLNAVPKLSEKMMVAFQMRREGLESRKIKGLKVIGPGGCKHTNEVREFLQKNFVPYSWDDIGCEFTPNHDGPGTKYPTVECADGQVLQRPSLQDVASAAGVWRGCPEEKVDLAIVGGGPAGLAAAVYAASEGLSTVVLDKLGPGGQAGGSSRIENFIGFPSGLSGNDLATRGVLQMLKFGAKMVAPVKVLQIEAATKPGEYHKVKLDCGATIEALCVLATTGVAWRRLGAEGAEKFERAGVYYACTTVEADLHDDADVAIVGGGNSAGQAVMFMAERCKQRTVHLLVRSPLGKGMSDYLVNRIRSTSNVKVHEGVEVTAVRGTRRVETLEITCCESREKTELKAQAVYVFIGAEPHADWLPPEVARDGGGYVLTGGDVVTAGKWPLADRPPCPLETSVPGILAGGDVRAGSTKRVGFAVGDGSLAVTCVHRLRAGR